jgi:hypothetical protein
MECRDAQFYLRLRRHAADELGSDVTAALDGHCAGCPDCAAAARTVESFDRAVSAAMRAVPIPAGLREKLITQAARVQGAALRRKAYRVGGTVAAALLVVGIGFSVFSSVRPKVNADAFVEDTERQMSEPSEYARNWLVEHKLPDRLPDNLDYDLLVSCDVVKKQGRDVPQLVFRSPEGSGFLKVYIFPIDGRFDLSDLRDAQSSQARAQVVIGRDRFRGFTYVFVHTTPNLTPFLRSRNGGIRA